MIEKLFIKNAGYLYSKDIQQNRMLQYKLKDLLDAGKVTKLRRGLYKYDAFASLDHWQEIALIYPKAVLCMHSAALYYNISTNISNVVHLAIGSKAKLKIESYPPVKIYYWSDKYYLQHVINKNGIKIFTLERTICDLIRLQKEESLDIVKEVSKEYLHKKDRNINLLLKTAREIDVYDKVSGIFEILI